jgi:hypothetical protein
MENMNLHKQKLFCLIAAGVGFIALLLPWLTYGIPLLPPFRKGFESWGLLALAGVAGVVAASLLGDKTKPFEGQFKLLALGSFAAIALAGILTLATKNSIGRSGGYGRNKYFDLEDISDEIGLGRALKPGFGVWLAIIVGIAGILLLMDIIKIPDNKPKV